MVAATLQTKFVIIFLSLVLFSCQNKIAINENESINGNNAYTLIEMMSDLKNGIWEELYTNKAIHVYRRNLQLAYLDRINFLMKPIGIPISIIAVILIYAIRPFRRINLYSIPSGRLGHLLLQPEFYLRKKKSSSGSNRTLDIFFTSRAMNSGVIANRQVLKMPYLPKKDH